MPDFSAIAVERKKATPGDAEIDEFLGTMAGRLATLEEIDEVRPAASGDVIIVDFEGG
jgi:trigger factor